MGQNSTIMKVVSQLLKASERRERTGHLVVQYLHCQEGTRGVKLGDCSVQEGVNSLSRLGDGQGRPHGTGFQVGLGNLFPAPGTLTGGVGHTVAYPQQYKAKTLPGNSKEVESLGDCGPLRGNR